MPRHTATQKRILCTILEMQSDLDHNTRKHHIQESHEVSPFQAADHKDTMNRQKACQTRNINNKNDPQNKHPLGIVSKIIFTGGPKPVLWYQPHPYFRCRSRNIIKGHVILQSKTGFYC